VKERIAAVCWADIEGFKQAMSALIAAGADLAVATDAPAESVKKKRAAKETASAHGEGMTAIIAALMGFIILSCFANTKSLIAIIGLAALFYVSLPAFFGLLMILGAIFYFSK
jgi:uncharacterized membrane protein YgcG